MMFLSPTLDTKSAQVTTAMFAACFVHLLWPAETSPGSKVGAENLLDLRSVLHISNVKGVKRGQHWNSWTNDDNMGLS